MMLGRDRKYCHSRNAHWLGLVLLLSVWPEISWGQIVRSAKPEDIKRAIDRGVAHLKSRISQQGQSGHQALGCVALLKAGTDPRSPEIQAVVSDIIRRCPNAGYQPGSHHYYEAAVDLLVLANADAKTYKPQIGVIAQHIMQGQGAQGQWHYPNQEEGDTSISQYGMLALWEASRAGIKIPMEVWDKAAMWHITRQSRDGGWAYHPGTGIHDSIHSMTVAGIGSLQIARRHLYPDSKELPIAEQVAEEARRRKNGKRYGYFEPVFHPEEGEENPQGEAVNRGPFVPTAKLAMIDAALERAINWETVRFTVSRPTGYAIYYLYGLERASALSGLEKYGSHDWYQEGADFLCATQTTNGSWVENAGEYPGAAFGVLFLTKATSKMVNRKTRQEFGAGILIGGRGLPDDLNNANTKNGKVVETKKPDQPVEDLLAILENPGNANFEIAQKELVEQVTIKDRNVLIGKTDLLKKYAVHPDLEVRRTAMWALGRCGDIRLAPVLINGLRDENLDVFIEARNGLRCLSRQVEGFTSQVENIDKAARDKEFDYWKNWYREARPYSERETPLPGE